MYHIYIRDPAHSLFQLILIYRSLHTGPSLTLPLHFALQFDAFLAMSALILIKMCFFSKKGQILSASNMVHFARVQMAKCGHSVWWSNAERFFFLFRCSRPIWIQKKKSYMFNNTISRPTSKYSLKVGLCDRLVLFVKYIKLFYYFKLFSKSHVFEWPND